MKKGIVLLSLLASMNGLAQTEVSDYTPGINAEGVTYFLPRTLIEVTLNAEREEYTPGEFCDYANKFLRMQGIANTPHTKWNMKSMTVKAVGVRDPQKGFTVKLKDKGIASLLELTDEGVLLSINRPTKVEAPNPQNDNGQAKKEADPKDFLNEEILSSTSTAKMAELVAKEIYNIRESRNAILRGQAENVPKDGEALKIILASLDEQESALIAMFKGKTKVIKEEATILLSPDETNDDENVLYRFSAKQGILAVDDLSGSPVYYSIKNLTDLPQPVEEKKAKKAKRPQGIVYNVPGKALLKIFNNKEVLYEEEIPVAQFGNTDVLATDLFNKGVTTRISFDPSTGAIRKIERE
ncbi:MAG: DUF4831 family protein [Bacteroidaceae bacterium]|nr:DUF4831 family protein [Bacteroidaceae bacterium]